MKRLVIATAVLAALSATPALAQSYNPSYGTGNSIVTPPSWQAQNNGRNAFAYAPEQSTRAHAPVLGFDSPAATGGGSVGYNDKLLHD